VGADDKGNWIFSPHDFEGFAQEVRHYGTWTSDLKLGGTAFVAAHQMGLFTDEDDDEDEEEGEDLAEGSIWDKVSADLDAEAGGAVVDDGAGTLIHPDGSALTDDEIEAMERHELADDPADPDAEYDEGELADMPTDEQIDASPADRDL
jgi:hypothetical protein